MFSKCFLLALSLSLSLSLTQANLIPRATRTVLSYSNTSTTASATTSKCCFLVQDTVSEIWWQQTSYSYEEVNLTSITTLITKYPNVTSTNYNTSVYTTTRTFSREVGLNPLNGYLNGAPGPTEITQVLNGTQAVQTGGIAIQSPAAFYVYNSVKIITVPVVTDDRGNVQCGVESVATGGLDATYLNINSHAQAYFGGSSIDGRVEVPTLSKTLVSTVVETDTVAGPSGGEVVTTATVTQTNVLRDYETFYTDIDGSTVTNDHPPTGTVISLVTPFIFQPSWGASGSSFQNANCPENAVSENYGYIPQTLLDYLIRNKQYSSQYPGLENCLPGGPSILGGGKCAAFTLTFQEPEGGDLTESTVIYVTPPGVKTDPTPVAKPQQNQDTPSTGKAPPTDQGKPQGQLAGDAEPQLNGGTPPGQQAAGGNPETHLGAIINSIMGGASKSVAAATGPGQPVVIPAATEIPVAQAPPGLTGDIKTVNGKPVIVVPGPTTVPAPLFAPAGIESFGSKTTIGGSPFVVVPGPTKIPLAEAPAGLKGTTTTIGGIPYLVIPGPATYALPGAGSIGSTTLIHGVPFVVYPGPTKIPLSDVPAALTGKTTTINGTPYLTLAKPTTVAVSGSPSLGRTTLIDGTPFVIIPGPTLVPSADAPSDLQNSGAKTTVQHGTTYLVVPSSTTVELGQETGQLTVIIDGSTRLIIAGPTTLPVNSEFPISGKTTVIGGKTMVVVTGDTTVAAKTHSTSSTASQTSTTTSTTATVTPTPTDKAPPSGVGRGMEVNGVLLGFVVLVAGFVL